MQDEDVQTYLGLNGTLEEELTEGGNNVAPKGDVEDDGDETEDFS